MGGIIGCIPVTVPALIETAIAATLQKGGLVTFARNEDHVACLQSEPGERAMNNFEACALLLRDELKLELLEAHQV